MGGTIIKLTRWMGKPVYGLSLYLVLVGRQEGLLKQEPPWCSLRRASKGL